MNISVIIVNYNTRDYLHNCLASIQAAADRAVEIIVIDNASIDGSAAMVRTHFPDVRLLTNDGNVGFAVANNQGARRATGRYLLLLNSDTQVTPGALERMTEFMDAHPELGICAPQNRNGADHELFGACGDEQINYLHFPRFQGLVGIGRALLQRFGISALQQSAPPPFLLREDERSVRYILADWLRGCSLFIRADLYRQLGGMDEGFFLYLEDTDLCRRVRQAGLGCAVVMGAIIVHYGGASYAGQEGVRIKTMIGPHFLRAKYYYVRKSQGQWWEWNVRLADLLVGARLLGRQVVGAKDSSTAAMGRLLIAESTRFAGTQKRLPLQPEDKSA